MAKDIPILLNFIAEPWDGLAGMWAFGSDPGSSGGSAGHICETGSGGGVGGGSGGD